MGHPLFAALYDKTMDAADAAGLGERRERLVAKATGRVLEIGAGTGRNLKYYRGVDELVVVEPDAAMARRLRRRLAAVSVPVTVIEATLDRAELETGSFDSIVCSLVLCSVRDVRATLQRVDELLAPDGRVLLLEHVRAVGWRGRLQDWSAPLWGAVAAGCHPNRDAVQEMRDAGFAVTDCDRFRVPRALPIVAPGIAAVAIRRVRPAPGVPA